MADATTTVGELRERVHEFVQARDWGRFHRPKDLAMALSIEASELLERFLWKGDSLAKPLNSAERTAIEDELADVVIYALSFANAMGTDLTDAVVAKLEKNEARYPADRVRGVAP